MVKPFLAAEQPHCLSKTQAQSRGTFSAILESKFANQAKLNNRSTQIQMEFPKVEKFYKAKIDLGKYETFTQGRNRKAISLEN